MLSRSHRFHAIQWLISFLLLSFSHSHPFAKIHQGAFFPLLFFSHIFPPSPFLQKSTMALELIGGSILSPVIQVVFERLASSKATNSMMAIFWKSWMKHCILSTDYSTMRRRSRLQVLLWRTGLMMLSMLSMKLRTYWRRLIMNIYDPRTLMPLWQQLGNHKFLHL